MNLTINGLVLIYPLTSQTNVKEKDENNNQWTSTLKKSREMYATNCHLEKHNNKN